VTRMAADPPGAQQAREALVLVAADWVRRRRATDGEPPMSAVLRQGLELAAAGAPRLAVLFPELLHAIGPPAACRIKAQAAALAASAEARAAAGEARWLTTAQAAAALGISPNGVRDLLRRGRLDGRRRECGWRVDAGSVQGRRRNVTRAAVSR
jgi:hypothetical protein